ncbi:hypothetical protein ANO11243_072390 [Dothideomycetidae sp. 11243]|nr:hypothetical protein ANO11243_072390 [fungal sp. No.11243]
MHARTAPSTGLVAVGWWVLDKKLVKGAWRKVRRVWLVSCPQPQSPVVQTLDSPAFASFSAHCPPVNRPSVVPNTASPHRPIPWSHGAGDAVDAADSSPPPPTTLSSIQRRLKPQFVTRGVREHPPPYPRLSTGPKG